MHNINRRDRDVPVAVAGSAVIVKRSSNCKQHNFGGGQAGFADLLTDQPMYPFGGRSAPTTFFEEPC